MSGKHTPRPWAVDVDVRSIISKVADDFICGPIHGRGDYAEANANARLIAAAAPDLLEQLIAIQFGFNGRCPACAGWNVSPYGETDKAHTKDCPVALAISKATGTTP